MIAFLQDHLKPVLLWVVGGGIWLADTITEMANGALNSAEKLGSLSVPTLLALISIILGFWIYWREGEIKAEKLAQEKKDEAREQRMIQLVDRNSNAMESMTDAVDEMRAETAKQTAHFEGVGQKLIERGLSATGVPHARKGITSRTQQ